MDSYKLEDVKKIIEKNLLSPEVLKNILKSTTRRIENYDDNEAVEILNYLSNNDAVPAETKEELNKYLSEYNNYHIAEVEKGKDIANNGNNRLTIIYVLIIILLVVVIISFLNR